MPILHYLRVSCDQQDHDSQRHALRSQQADGEYVDVGTGANTERPALQELLRDVRKGDVVVTYKLDRISRSVVDLLNIVDHLNKVGAELVSVTEALDTRSPMGRFTLTLLAGLGEMERERIKERVRAGMAARKARGLPVGSSAKALRARAERGMKSQQAARQAAAEALRWVVEPLAGRPHAEVARLLNERGIPTTAGGQWRHQSVRNLMRRLELATA